MSNQWGSCVLPLDQGTAALFLTLEREKIVLFQSIFETYEHLAVTRTLEADLIALIFTTDRQDEVFFVLSRVAPIIQFQVEDIEAIDPRFRSSDAIIGERS